MKYVFLTYSMAGLSGSPSYVNNKVKWLNERGIDTVVFDHYGRLDVNSEIVLENLSLYINNRMLELFFPPSFFTKKQRAKVLDRMYNTIGEANDYVVESNSPRLALWGELLAEKLYAKHLVLCVGEFLSIRSEEEYRFLDFKLNRRELFTIKPQAIQNLFKGYKVISDEEASNLFFSASMGVRPENVPFPELDGLPIADYRILSFGRYKPYFDNMIKGVVKFANNHKDQRINFLIWGALSLPSSSLIDLESASNLFVKFIPAKRPVPQVAFDYSDVVIATAGCANLSYRTGTRTISMDVQTCLPLGVMGFTTLDSVYSSVQDQPLYDVCCLLEDVLIHHLYDGDPLLTKKPSGKGYMFQMGMINNNRLYWSGIDKIVHGEAFLKLCEMVVLRSGGISLLAKSRFAQKIISKQIVQHAK